MGYKGTGIRGLAKTTAEQMEAVARRVNPNAPSLAHLYLKWGAPLMIRGDFAYAQALHETNYFRYGGLVRPDQNNFAGLGATGPGVPGLSFAGPEDGVIAHLQHLHAYASVDPLPPNMPLVDPRYQYVHRGSATKAGDLNGKWTVPGTDYGQMIDRILGDILMEPTEREPYQITRSYLNVGSQNRPGCCAGSGCWQGVDGIVVHRTASPTMNASAIRNYFNTVPDGRHASSQFVVDNENILQLMPIGEVAYHTAGKNLSFLGIETCEHNWGTEQWAETYRKLVWLTSYLIRMFQLDMSAVTGHFWWDPTDRIYDPTHLGWTIDDGQATGLFNWNQFVSDVFAGINEGTQPKRVTVEVIRTVRSDCTTGLLVNNTTYVPVRSIAACLSPQASVRWDPDEYRVVIEMGPDGAFSAAGHPNSAAPPSSTTPSAEG